MSTSQQLLEQQVIYLIEQGTSLDDAIKQVNQSNFAQQQQINIHSSDFSFNSDTLKKQYSSLSPVFAQHQAALAGKPETTAALQILQQQQELMITGWKTFRSSFLSSLIYIVFLSCLVLFFRIFIGPQFLDMYTGFGGDLPAITQLILGPGGLLILAALWLLSLTYLFLVILISRRIKIFKALPGWLRKLPVFHQFKASVDRMMMLSISEFIQRTDIQTEIADWYKWFTPIEHKTIDYYYHMTMLSKEFNSSNRTIRQEKLKLENEFITIATKSSKGLALTFSIILGVSIALFVIAMYAPIFQLGSVI